MAEDHAQPGRPPAVDYAGHEKTYRMFIQLIKYTVAGAALALALLLFSGTDGCRTRQAFWSATA